MIRQYSLLNLTSSSSTGFYNPLADFSLLILEVSRSHHNRQDSSGRGIDPSQRPLPDKTTQQTNIHAPGGIRTRNVSRISAADPRLRPLGHWDRLLNPTGAIKSRLTDHIAGEFLEGLALYQKIILQCSSIKWSNRIQNRDHQGPFVIRLTNLRAPRNTGNFLTGPQVLVQHS